MEKVKISCIITTYNRPIEVLDRAVCSVKSQTYGEQFIEIIVVNDAPENISLAERLEKYCQEKNVRYIAHEKNMGACVARNTGIKNSTGELIGFLDDDDEWLPNKLELLVPYFSDNKIALVYGDYYTQADGERKIIKRKYYGKRPMKEILLSNYIGSTSLPLLRKASVVRAGMFDPVIRSSQDHDLWIRIIQLFDVAYCDKPIAIYNISDISITSGAGNRTAGYNQLLEKYRSLYEQYRDSYRQRLLIVSRTMARDGNICESWPFFMKCVRISPFKIDQLTYLGSVVKGIGRKRGRHV